MILILSRWTLAKFLSKKYAKQIAQEITTDSIFLAKILCSIDPADHEKLQTYTFYVLSIKMAIWSQTLIH